MKVCSSGGEPVWQPGSGSGPSGAHQWTPTLLSHCAWRRNLPLQGGTIPQAGLQQGRTAIPQPIPFVNPPGTPYARIHCLVRGSPDGELSPSLGSLQPGDFAGVQSQATRFSDPGRAPPGQDLWLLSPAPPSVPSLAMRPRTGLRATSRIWCWYQRGAQRKELTIQPITSLVEQYGPAFFMFPSSAGTWPDRCPADPGRHRQWRAAGGRGARTFPEHSQVMICGNPAMGEGDSPDPAPEATSAWKIKQGDASGRHRAACRHLNDRHSPPGEGFCTVLETRSSWMGMLGRALGRQTRLFKIGTQQEMGFGMMALTQEWSPGPAGLNIWQHGVPGG